MRMRYMEASNGAECQDSHTAWSQGLIRIAEPAVTARAAPEVEVSSVTQGEPAVRET